jgi:hypothetical protein
MKHILLASLGLFPLATFCFADGENVCFIGQQCIDGRCDEPAGRPVIVLSPLGERFLVELGQYRETFTSELEFELSPMPGGSIRGKLEFSFTSADGKPGHLKLWPDPDAQSDFDTNQHLFEYARMATLEGRSVQVVSTGNCIDPEHVAIGYSLAAGFYRSDQDQRWYADPTHWEGVIAHCKLDTRDEMGKAYIDEFWIHPEDPYDPALSCWSYPGGDAMMCLHRQVVTAGGLFIDSYSNDGSRLEIAENGSAVLKWVDYGGPDGSPRVMVSKGRCEKGRRW